MLFWANGISQHELPDVKCSDILAAPTPSRPLPVNGCFRLGDLNRSKAKKPGRLGFLLVFVANSHGFRAYAM